MGKRLNTTNINKLKFKRKNIKRNLILKMDKQIKNRKTNIKKKFNIKKKNYIPKRYNKKY